MILHANELGPVVLLSDKLHLRELIGPHRTCSDVSDFAGFYEIVKGFHRFFNGNIRVEAVDLEEVEVWRIETFEGGFDVGKDGIAGKTWSQACEWEESEKSLREE